MPDLIPEQPAEFRFTLQITRAATGETETIEMVGTPIPIPAEPTHTEEEQ